MADDRDPYREAGDEVDMKDSTSHTRVLPGCDDVADAALGPADARVRLCLEVQGLVQGVGFRPFVYATASALGLTGSVANTESGVRVEVEGRRAAVEELARRLPTGAPPLAEVRQVLQEEVPLRGGTGFTIEDSTTGGRARTLASPDVATCVDCLRELADPTDRRHRHPFVTCTNCGPRFTIITGLPYDRAATTMARFEMCARCRREYEDPTDRRFHAQPVACPECGPTLRLLRASGSTGEPSRPGQAVAQARRLLAGGAVLAVKGLGGYHLACDARNAAAVAELRRRKRRGAKPFAVMVRDLEVARRLVRVDAAEEAVLAGVRRPVVLLPRRPDAEVAEEVAPGNPDLGVMLPYTPLHTLLLGLAGDQPLPDALVMTSGNLSGEPIVTDDAEALDRLAPLVDGWLLHDRRIHVPCDDSVTRVVGGTELPVRRSRGYAPLPIALPFDVPPTLAVGADLKNTCAVAAGRYAWVSQHVGDMDDLATVQALTRIEGHLEMLTGVVPGQLAADAHPGYRSSAWAREHAGGRVVHRVQHHHAHVAAVMGEHGVPPDEPVIGVAFDGTGFGTDGAVWGGEVLVADYKSFRRAAHLSYVPLAGGDASVLRPRRMALAHLFAAGVEWDPALPAVRSCRSDERRVIDHQLRTGFGCVPTSSMGRLFDAVASLVGVRHEVDFEAQAAIELEGLARGRYDECLRRGEGYRFALAEAGAGEPIVADVAPVVRGVCADVRAGEPPSVVAARFHVAVVTLVLDLARACRERTGIEVVALGGGVFQNALLLGSAQEALAEAGFTVLRPRLLPPNDGGIALGQVLVAASG